LPFYACYRSTGICHPWINADCVEGKCVCRSDACRMGQQCVPKGHCPTVTGGSCVVGPCDRWRNATCDDESRKCLCRTGSCPVSGECRLPGDCAKDTGGTCNALSCQPWRRATCSVDFLPGITEQAKCLCGEGACPVRGECVPKGGCPRYTGSSCGLFGFSWGFDGQCSQGACEDGYCQCPEGQCYVDGECKPAGDATVQLSLEWQAAPQKAYREETFVRGVAVVAACALVLALVVARMAARQRRGASLPPGSYEHLNG